MLNTIFGTIPTLRRHRISVSIFFFVAGFTFASWASRIPDIQAKLSLSEGQLGAVLFALPIGLMTSLMVSGGLVTRYGSQIMARIASLGYSALLPLLGIANTTWQLVAVLFFFGIAGNMYNISCNTQAISLEKMYGRSIMASFHGIWSTAGFSGAAVGTLMVNFNLLPWQHFLLISMLGLAATTLFYPHIVPSDNSTAKRQRFALPNGKLLQLGLIAFGCLVCEGTMFEWSGVYFKKVVQVPAAFTTVGYAAFMGCMATGRFVADGVVTRFGPKRVLQLAGLVIFSGLMLAVLVPHLVVATLAFMMVGFGVSSVVPVVYSQAGKSTTLSPSQALAAVSTVGFAGFLVGPPLVGFLAQITNLRWSFGAVACIGLMTTVLASTLTSKKATYTPKH
ncbi:MAG: MFS transporter [Bacteroidetes bacterium]|nr:MAG: MFS transporter [Bacteroidota bacterium]